MLLYVFRKGYEKRPDGILVREIRQPGVGFHQNFFHHVSAGAHQTLRLLWEFLSHLSPIGKRRVHNDDPRVLDGGYRIFQFGVVGRTPCKV